MGIDVIPILTKICMALLEKELKDKCKRDPKLIWPKLGQFLINVPKRMRLGVSTDFREDIMFWIDKFNELCDTITIDI